jgi:hypothetical protein
MGRGIEGTKIFRQDTVRVRDSGWVAKEIMRGEGLGESELRSGRRQRKVSRGEAFVLSVGGREDGISRGGGGAVSGCDHIGCASCGLFGGTARTPQVSVSTFGKNVPFILREDGISRGGGGAVSGCDHIGCASCGLSGGTARTPQVSVSTFGKNVPFTFLSFSKGKDPTEQDSVLSGRTSNEHPEANSRLSLQGFFDILSQCNLPFHLLPSPG